MWLFDRLLRCAKQQRSTLVASMGFRLSRTAGRFTRYSKMAVVVKYRWRYATQSDGVLCRRSPWVYGKIAMPSGVYQPSPFTAFRPT